MTAVPKRIDRLTEFAVRYRREGWGSAQNRLFQSQQAAARFVDKLARPSKLAPLIFVVVEVRDVGPWMIVDEA